MAGLTVYNSALHVDRNNNYDDMRIVPGAFEFPGVADPTLNDWQPGGSGTVFPVYVFAVNDYVIASVQIPHEYKEGTDLLFHLHWTPRDRGVTENGNKVGWKVDYTIANVDGTFASSQTVDLSDACSGVDDKHEITSEVAVSGTGITVSAMLILKIYRSDTGDDDTWAGSIASQLPALLEFDIHYNKDSVGSNTTTHKTW